MGISMGTGSERSRAKAPASAGRAAAVTMLLALLLSSVRPAAAATKNDWVIILGGIGDGGALDYRVYDTLVQRLGGAGYSAMVLETQTPWLIPETAGRLLELVNFLKLDPANKVHLIGHSIGGLSARWYLQLLEGSSRIESYASVGTPHQGLRRACEATPEGGAQICWTGDVMSSLSSDDQTPGSLPYLALWGTVDELLIRADIGLCPLTGCDYPRETQYLHGGACHRKTNALDHGRELEHEPTLELLSKWLAAPGGLQPALWSCGTR